MEINEDSVYWTDYYKPSEKGVDIFRFKKSYFKIYKTSKTILTEKTRNQIDSINLSKENLQSNQNVK